MEEMGFDEEKEWDKLWIKHRNAMIHMLICGVILGFCIGLLLTNNQSGGVWQTHIRKFL